MNARRDQAQSSVEYALIVGMVAIVVVAVLLLVGPRTGRVFSQIAASEGVKAAPSATPTPVVIPTPTIPPTPTVCPAVTYPLGTLSVPALSGIYYAFRSGVSPSTIAANGVFSSTVLQTHVEVYAGHPFGVTGGPANPVPAEQRIVASGSLLNAASGSTAGTRTASYPISAIVSGPVFAGGNFTALYYNENIASTTVISASVAACGLSTP